MIIARSAIIPRVNIGRTIAVARAFGKSKSLSRDQITQKIGLKPGTGGANIRVIAAKQFGLIAPASQGGYMLTELGRRLAAGGAPQADYLQAFRTVPAFAKLLDRFDGDPLSVAEGDVRKALQEFGVAAEDIDRAFTIFTRSWTYLVDQKSNGGGTSGKGASGSPTVGADDGSTPGLAGDAAAGDAGDDGDAGDASGTEITEVVPAPVVESIGSTRAFPEIPVIRAVLDLAPGEGEIWSSDSRDAWLELLKSAVRFTYREA